MNILHTKSSYLTNYLQVSGVKHDAYLNKLINDLSNKEKSALKKLGFSSWDEYNEFIQNGGVAALRSANDKIQNIVLNFLSNTNLSTDPITLNITANMEDIDLASIFNQLNIKKTYSTSLYDISITSKSNISLGVSLNQKSLKQIAKIFNNRLNLESKNFNSAFNTLTDIDTNNIVDITNGNGVKNLTFSQQLNLLKQNRFPWGYNKNELQNIYQFGIYNDMFNKIETEAKTLITNIHNIINSLSFPKQIIDILNQYIISQPFYDIINSYDVFNFNNSTASIIRNNLKNLTLFSIIGDEYSKALSNSLIDTNYHVTINRTYSLEELASFLFLKASDIDNIVNANFNSSITYDKSALISIIKSNAARILYMENVINKPFTMINGKIVPYSNILNNMKNLTINVHERNGSSALGNDEFFNNYDSHYPNFLPYWKPSIRDGKGRFVKGGFIPTDKNNSTYNNIKSKILYSVQIKL